MNEDPALVINTIFSKAPDLWLGSRKAPCNALAEAEDSLGVDIPVVYRNFLMDCLGGRAFGLNFYGLSGICPQDVQFRFIYDLVETNTRLRNSEWPRELLAFCDGDSSTFWCFDLKARSNHGDAPIRVCGEGGDGIGGVVAQCFPEFLIRLENEEEDLGRKPLERGSPWRN